MSVPIALRDGYRRFREGRFALEAERYRALAKGQKPTTMIIGCADSRVDPATIFSAAPGELFVVRNVAALVPPFEDTGTYHGTSAAIEFAVEGLGVVNIVVLGHGMCGGVQAALASANRRPVGRFIGPWVELLSGVRNRLLVQPEGAHPAGQQQALERLAVQLSLDNLMTFPFVAKALEAKKLELHGAWFSIAEGQLYWLDQRTKKFMQVTAPDPPGPPSRAAACR